jgi:LCP family protein required for cell wall assembly
MEEILRKIKDGFYKFKEQLIKIKEKVKLKERFNKLKKKIKLKEKFENIKEKVKLKILNLKDKSQNNTKEKKEKSKVSKVVKIVLILLLIIVIALVVLIGKYITDRISKINFKDLDESNLEINDNMYNELSGDLTQSEYDNIINIILLGSDSKDMDEQYKGNSDCQIIISVNPKYKSIKLISIPRDTAADIEGFGTYKINYAFYLGKEELALKTINKTFDLNLKEYVTINISAMYDIINELGGVEVNITKDEMKWINEYVDMFYKLSGKPTKKVTKYGRVTLTGEQAAAHCKERMAGTDGDFGRTERQREIIMSLLNKIASQNPSEISKSIDLILSQVTTNVDVAKYMTKLPEFIANKDAYLSNITSVMVPARSYSKEGNVNGVYLFRPDIEKAKADFRKYMYEM